jgi:hypothetical protein
MYIFFELHLQFSCGSEADSGNLIRCTYHVCLYPEVERWPGSLFQALGPLQLFLFSFSDDDESQAFVHVQVLNCSFPPVIVLLDSESVCSLSAAFRISLSDAERWHP